MSGGARCYEQTMATPADWKRAIVGSMGTPTNTAIVKYMNAKKVPHILLASGASKWGHPKENPWTM